MTVYFIQAEDGGPIKIGYAADEMRRVQQIQVGHHEKLVLRHAILGDKDTESEIHWRFRRYRLRGEWFFPAPELVKFARANGDVVPGSQMDLAEDLAEMLQEFGHEIQALDIFDVLDVCGFDLVKRRETA